MGQTRGGHMADTWRTNGRQGHLGGGAQAGHVADTRRSQMARQTQGGHKAGTNGRQGLEAGPQRTQGAQGGHMADARPAHGRHMTRILKHGQSGLHTQARPIRLKADTRRTTAGQV